MKYHRKAILGHFSHGEKFRSKKKSGWFDKTILAAGLLLLVFAAFSVVTKGDTFATELNATITIKFLQLRNADNQSITVVSGNDASADPADYAVKVTDNEPLDLNMVFGVDFGEDHAIKAGDKLLIPVVAHNAVDGSVPSRDLDIAEFGSIELMADETKIGVVERVDNGLLITFAPEASGMTSFDALIFELEDLAYADSLSGNRVGYITIAGQKYSFGVSGTNLTNLDDDTYAISTATDSIVWRTNAGSGLTNTLSSSRGSVGVARDLYVEQEFPEASGYESIAIRETHMVPQSLAANSGASSVVADYIDRTNSFTEVKQNSGESYASFAQRVMSRASQYGFYKDASGLRSIINFGVLGIDTPFASADTWAASAADNAIAQGYYLASNKDALINYYRDSFGSNSNIEQSPAVSWDIRVSYPNKFSGALTTDAYWTEDDAMSTVTTSAKLATTRAYLQLPARQVQLTVIDSASNEVVNGGLYKFQCKKDDGTYADYAPTEDYENTKRVTKNGTIVFSNIEPNKTCRIVGLEVPKGYDITSSEGYNATDKVTYTKEFSTTVMEGKRIVIRNKKSATPEPEDDDEDDDDSPAAPNTGLGTADETSGSTDAGIYAMTAFGVAMIVIAIKRKVSLD